MEIEKLDVNNIIEIEQIKLIIERVATDPKPLLKVLNDIISHANKNLNLEAPHNTHTPMDIEDMSEPNLSDHESDEGE
jgi:hypothetical protein